MNRALTIAVTPGIIVGLAYTAVIYGFRAFLVVLVIVCLSSLAFLLFLRRRGLPRVKSLRGFPRAKGHASH
jgi:hypothetical protein